MLQNIISLNVKIATLTCNEAIKSVIPYPVFINKYVSTINYFNFLIINELMIELSGRNTEHIPWSRAVFLTTHSGINF